MNADAIERATLVEARHYVADRLERGVECPCCHQFAKRYRRKLNGSMAYALILIDRYFRDPMAQRWLHVPAHLANAILHPRMKAAIRGDVGKLVWWGLIQSKPGKRDDGSYRTGYYAMTQLGRDFVRDRAKVPARVVLYNNRFIRFDGADVSIRDVLSTRFNYEELMAA